jgi:hypothetical protein
MNISLADLYTPLPEAVCELHARRSSPRRVGESGLERHLVSRPHAVLFRQVATPNFELERFVGLALSAGLSPLVLEFHRDKFVTRNTLKYSLARMGFYGGIGRNGGPRVRYLAVVDLPTADGLELQQTATTWGQSLIEFHHELLTERPLFGGLELYDGSEWFAEHGPTAHQYYTALLALFVEHAILFESFLLTPTEQQFTTEVVLPAFEAVQALHGQHPLICRLDPAVTEGHAFWLQYPDALHSSVATRLAPADLSGSPQPVPAA